jgi:hypothetical protein
MSNGAKMTEERSYSDLSDSATTFDPEEQFDRDIDERMKGMTKEETVAMELAELIIEPGAETRVAYCMMLAHVAISAADKWDAEQGKGKTMRPLTEAEHRAVMNALADSGEKQYDFSPVLDSAIQKELDHPPAPIMEEGK